MVEASSSPAATVTTHYVIEHFEAEFSDWTFAEYVHMLLTLNKLYDTKVNEEGQEQKKHTEILILTNFPFIAQLRRGELDDDELGTKRNTEKFLQLITKPVFADSVRISERAFQALTTGASSSGEQAETQNSGTHDHSDSLASLL